MDGTKMKSVKFFDYWAIPSVRLFILYFALGHHTCQQFLRCLYTAMDMLLTVKESIVIDPHATVNEIVTLQHTSNAEQL